MNPSFPKFLQNLNMKLVVSHTNLKFFSQSTFRQNEMLYHNHFQPNHLTCYKLPLNQLFEDLSNFQLRNSKLVLFLYFFHTQQKIKSDRKSTRLNSSHV